jgi:hypothetical protein
MLGRTMTASAIRGWSRASRNCASRPRLVSSESELRLLPNVGLGRVVTAGGLGRGMNASPVRGWSRASHDCEMSRASHDCISRSGLASGESWLRSLMPCPVCQVGVGILKPKIEPEPEPNPNRPNCRSIRVFRFGFGSYMWYISGYGFGFGS